MKRFVRWSLCLALTAALACTQEEPPKVRQLRAKLVAAEKELVTLEEKMKDPTLELGAKDRANTDRELMKARVERVRMALESAEIAAGLPPTPRHGGGHEGGKSEGEGHEGGGHGGGAGEGHH